MVHQLALGVDPADEGLMHRPPRPVGEGVITGRMWRGIFFVGTVMAAGTLFVLDASMPGGFVAGEGNLRYGQTMAFTTLMLFQMFNVVNARSDERSAFVHLFTNQWLWGAVAGSVALQVLVVYVPVLQRAFGTVGLTARDWTVCIGRQRLRLEGRKRTVWASEGLTHVIGVPSRDPVSRVTSTGRWSPPPAPRRTQSAGIGRTAHCARCSGPQRAGFRRATC
jgi:magnesium-transporting ATPase (P-type)